MMTGAILGGSSVDQAVKLQTVILFLISSAAALSALVASLIVLHVIVDDRLRLRRDRTWAASKDSLLSTLQAWLQKRRHKRSAGVSSVEAPLLSAPETRTTLSSTRLE